MDNQIVENDLMKLWSQTGNLKMKTSFCFIKTNQKFRKERTQRTKIKQRESTNIL